MLKTALKLTVTVFIRNTQNDSEKNGYGRFKKFFEKIVKKYDKKRDILPKCSCNKIFFMLKYTKYQIYNHYPRSVHTICLTLNPQRKEF